MIETKLKQLLKKVQAKESSGLTDLAEPYQEWEWQNCKVRQYNTDQEVWVLLPGFHSWMNVVIEKEEDGEIDLDI